MKSKFNQTSTEQQVWQAQKFMIDPSRKFKPVLQPNQRTKILVSQGMNTNSDMDVAGDLVAVDDKSLISEEPVVPVNIRMKRVTLSEISSCQQDELHPAGDLGERDCAFRELLASTHGRNSNRQSVTVRPSESKPPLNRLVEELEPSCDSPTKMHIESSRDGREACDDMILQAELATGEPGQVPEGLNALQSVLTSLSTSQRRSSPSPTMPEPTGDFGDVARPHGALPGLQ